MTGNIKFLKILHKHKGVVVWLTGLPCSGKTTLSKELERYFRKNKLPVQRLDGDIVRDTINKDLGFSKVDRDKNIERVTYIAQLLSNNGINVIVAFVSPYRKMRSFARKICSNFIEVYVKCDLKECIKRDVKGMYKRAISGEINNFTGIQDPYEKPINPELILETQEKTAKENVNEITSFLKIISRKRKTQY